MSGSNSERAACAWPHLLARGLVEHKLIKESGHDGEEEVSKPQNMSRRAPDAGQTWAARGGGGRERETEENGAQERRRRGGGRGDHTPLMSSLMRRRAYFSARA